MITSEMIQMVLLTEKYEPQTLNEVVGHPKYVTAFKKWNKNNTHPSMVIDGNWGTGKSSIVKAGLKDYFGALYRSNVLIKNASRKENRGIEAIESDIQYMRVLPKGGFPYRFLVYDEADMITPQAQKSLKEPMSTWSKQCKVIFITNDYDGIDGGLTHRALRLHMNDPTDEKEIIKWLTDIMDKENMDYDPEYFVSMTLNPRTILKDLDAIANGIVPDDIDIPKMVDTFTTKIFNALKEKPSKKLIFTELYNMYDNMYSIQPHKSRSLLRLVFRSMRKKYFDMAPSFVGELSKLFSIVDVRLQNAIEPGVHNMYMIRIISESVGKK